jgi:hypothetical protein
MSEKLRSLISRLGSNAHSAVDNGNGSANVETTPAQASKLSDLLGEAHVNFVKFAGSRIVVAVSIAELEAKAASAQKVRSGSSIKVDIASRILYAIDAPDAKNRVTEAWWEAAKLEGGITVNGIEYRLFAGSAEEYYAEPEDSAKAAEWNPERTVYVVELPTDEGQVVLTSYGITNLIRRVAGRNEVIG